MRRTGFRKPFRTLRRLLLAGRMVDTNSNGGRWIIFGHVLPMKGREDLIDALMDALTSSMTIAERRSGFSFRPRAVQWAEEILPPFRGGDMENQGASIGVLVTLELPTRGMVKEANDWRFFEQLESLKKLAPRIQILTAKEIFAEKEINYFKLSLTTFSKAASKPSKTRAEKERLAPDGVLGA